MLNPIRQFFRYNRKLVPRLLSVFLPITLIIYVLRGFEVLSFLPGAIILWLMMLSLVTGIIYGLEKTGGI